MTLGQSGKLARRNILFSQKMFVTHLASTRVTNLRWKKRMFSS